MTTPQHTWLASYPRSGNTLLRTILFQCLNAPSASIYDEDLGGTTLSGLAGHVQHTPDGQLCFPKGKIPLFKTHKHPPDDAPAIYVLREGREATASLFRFYGGKIPIEDVVTGKQQFGTWAEHVRAWDPINRPNTLLVRYEEMLSDQMSVIGKLSEFLGLPVVSDKIPSREQMAMLGKKWVNKKTNWRSVLSGKALKEFMAVNKATLKDFGY